MSFECELDLRWSDMDLNGHVNHARIITLAEEARIRSAQEWFGTTPGGNHPRVVRTLDSIFDQPVYYTSTVTAQVKVTHLGNTSFTLQQDIIQNGERCARITTVLVTVDPDTARPRPIEDAARQKLQELLESGE